MTSNICLLLFFVWLFKNSLFSLSGALYALYQKKFRAEWRVKQIFVVIIDDYGIILS